MENTEKKEKISEEVPRDVQREIMSWLPKKSLTRFLCVSKNWSSTIREEAFKEYHYQRSNTRPRALFVFCRNEFDSRNFVLSPPDFLFHSVYQEEEPLLSSGQQEMRITNELIHEISAPIRGLICLQSRTKVMICNPGIQKFQTLPESNVSIVRSFFGYDEDSDVFKVLYTSTPQYQYGIPTGTIQFEVYTMGSGEESWRRIFCEHCGHAIVTNSLCQGGVVYYGAWDTLSRNKSILMSFNVRSEEFTVIELPKRVKIKFSTKLVNYNGYIALVNDSVNDSGAIQMLIWNDKTGKWWREGFVIRRWRANVGDMRFSFEGTIGTGEFVFAQKGLLDGKSLFVVYYDRATKNLRKFKIEGGAEGGSYYFARTFLNHVDSSLLQ